MARPQPRWNDDRLREAPPLDGSSGHPVVDAILRSRGITGPSVIQDWLDGSPRPAPDPTLFPRMEAALSRAAHAVERGERIGIFGDYDADGVTSTAILALALTAATRDPDRIVTRLPTRAEGYGLTPAAVDRFADQGVSLLIAVDCGSNDVPALDRGRERGVDVVVLDHHHLTREVGENEILVNPRLRADGDGHELVSAGLAYCFAAGLVREGVRFEPELDAASFLDLAAIGTIADVGDLTGRNRAIVRDGINELRRTSRPGLRALLDIAGCTRADVDTSAVSFKLGPRLNAPGRIDSARVVLDLLLAEDPIEARRAANAIESLNTVRKARSAEIEAQANAQVEASLDAGARLVVAHGAGWEVGIVGAVAGKLADAFGLPAVVLTDRDDGLSVGSARSVDGFDLVGALEANRDLLERFGGHTRAAGLTVRTAAIPELVERLSASLAGSGLVLPAPLEHRIDADLRTPDLTLATIRSIQPLAPFGAGNLEPLFRLRNARVLQVQRMGADQSHLRLVVQGPGAGIKAVMFRAGDRAAELAGRTEIDLLATLEADTWGGDERFALKVVDFRPTSA